MTPLETIRDALTRPLADQTGNPVRLALLPPLNGQEIDSLENTLPAPLPPTIREMLARCRGLSGPLGGIDFTGASIDFEQEDVFPYGIPIAGDGFGNFWVVDLTERSTDWGPVYFASHDPPVVLFQSSNLTEFLAEVFRLYEPPYKSLVSDVREDRICRVWRTNPGVVTVSEAGEDTNLSSFVESLDDTWLVVDLRGAGPGDGFSWGRFGPDTEIRRFGPEPVFAYRKPIKKRGFLAGLWDRT